MCEEFHCLPSEAVRELRRNRAMVSRIVEYRGYANAAEAVRQAKDDTQLPPEGENPMVDLYFEIEARMLKERKDRYAEP